MIYIAEIILLLANIAMADYHAHLFKQGKTIQHGLWGFAYLVLTGLFCWLNHSWLLALASLLIRQVFFNISLNLFERRGMFFVSTETKSIVDKIHYFFFKKHSEIYQLIYFIGLIILNFFL